MKKLNVNLYQGNPEELATNDNNNLFIEGDIEYNTGGGTKINSITSIKDVSGVSVPISGGSGGSGSLADIIMSLNASNARVAYLTTLVSSEDYSFIDLRQISGIKELLDWFNKNTEHGYFVEDEIGGEIVYIDEPSVGSGEEFGQKQGDIASIMFGVTCEYDNQQEPIGYTSIITTDIVHSYYGSNWESAPADVPDGSTGYILQNEK